MGRKDARKEMQIRSEAEQKQGREEEVEHRKAWCRKEIC